MSVTAGVAATAAYDTSDGLNHSENILEGYIEAEMNGIYGGVWIGSLEDDPADDAEIEVYLGYGGDISDRLGYDISLTGYYLNDSGYQNYDITTALSYAFNDSVTGSLELAYDPDNEDLDRSIELEIALTDRVWLRGLVGESDADANTYAELSVGYALTDAAALELLYEDADDSAGTLSFIVSYDFNLFGG
ncbi:TorF family putative porin [Thalassovita taeanensis]|uniref:TorF family putative porin n=1 Tax=Thalassovita taeanensis TaxID=657014 RepID=UPI00158798CA|nr:TorF family putative porin [Thalassovita taeanensis]